MSCHVMRVSLRDEKLLLCTGATIVMFARTVLSIPLTENKVHNSNSLKLFELQVK